jgi:hypothetical protein
VYRRFVWRCFVEEMFCRGDVLSRRRFVEETFCMCAPNTLICPTFFMTRSLEIQDNKFINNTMFIILKLSCLHNMIIIQP